ncbi:hypothetical protein ACFL2H_02040 [Planctomycetota bacterium]
MTRQNVTRRQFTASSAALLFAPTLAAARGGSNQGRKQIAFLGTEVRQHSHAQHFLDRLTEGYAWAGGWTKPRVDVASVYIDQFPKGDLAKQRITKHQLKQFASIKDALTLGTGKLAVDGVVIIAEHGDYPTNDKGQKRYPRYEWFKEVVKVFEASGRSVPVFNDKHLSTNWDECLEMVADAKRLGFEFLAGSSLPVTRRMPEIDMPYDANLTESVCVAYGGVDSYDIHALETAQCMSERRAGGEVGIESVHAVKNEKLWELLDADERAMTRKLAVAALTRSHNLPVEGGFPTAAVSYEWFKKTLPSTTGYFIQHRDGFHTTMLLTGIRDFNYAGYIADKDKIVSCQMYLPMPTHGSTTADFFNPLTRHIEDLIINDKSPYPVERTLLTSGMVIAGVNSLHAGQTKIGTPKMGIPYNAPRESTYWQG